MRMDIKKKASGFIISIVIITIGRETLYPLVQKLLNQDIRHGFEIILVPQRKLKEDILNDKRIKIFYEPLGEGFAYYRNIGISVSKGELIVFIDDDEFPMDEHWLERLTHPIIDKRELVTTSGCYIPLGNGYLTDAISFLGFPGGGYIGFKNMWNIDQEGYTKHLCSGNCAFDKSFLKKIGRFSKNLFSGSEDVDIAEKILQNSEKIMYVENATVFHSPRSGLFNFIKWNIKRGKSAYEFAKNRKLKGSHVKGRFESSIKILKRSSRSKYFPAVLTLSISQYLLQFTGYMLKRID